MTIHTDPTTPKNKTRHLPELLAPAGNWACLRAAVGAGCDAVYFGVAGLNMRAGAANFTLDDLPDIRNLCTEHAVKAYLAVNTIVYNRELELLRNILASAQSYVDAVICWDPAVISLCKEYHIPIHISTQASVSNTEAVAFYQTLGAERIVMARECTLTEVIRVRRECGVGVELFIHGAMCISVSGRCFLSQFTDGKSANRGECRQHCRREFHVMADDKTSEFRVGENFIMSAKDLCTMPFLEKLLEAGVMAFKIEGRNRAPEYVATVTTAYRQAMDAWADNRLTDKLKKQLVEDCRSVFNRDFSAGFYMGRPIGEMTDQTGSQATLRKDHVGRIANYFKQAKVAEIHIQNYCFKVGDRLLIDGPTSGAVLFEVTEIRQNEKSVAQGHRGTATVPLDHRVRANDLVYRLSPKHA